MSQTVEKSRGEVYEGVAFQFCKVATVALIAGRFALPVAAIACAVFYVMALVNGKRDTRCVLRYPALIAAFWILVAVGWGIFTYLPHNASSKGFRATPYESR